MLASMVLFCYLSQLSNSRRLAGAVAGRGRVFDLTQTHTKDSDRDFSRNFVNSTRINKYPLILPFTMTVSTTTTRTSRQYSLKGNSMDSAADKEERKREVSSLPRR